MDMPMDFLKLFPVKSKCNNPNINWQGISRPEFQYTRSALHILLFHAKNELPA